MGPMMESLSKIRDMKCPQCRINVYVSAMVDMDEKLGTLFQEPIEMIAS